MSKALVITVFLAIVSGCTRDGWELMSKTSEMTDEVVHTLGRKATEKIVLPKTALRAEEQIVRPWFAIRLYPGRGYQFEFFAASGLDYRGDLGRVTVRLDEEPPVTFTVHEVRGKTWVYRVGASDSFLRGMLDAKKMLRIEYVTLFDGTRVAHFPLDGFRPKLEELCDQFKRECAL